MKLEYGFLSLKSGSGRVNLSEQRTGSELNWKLVWNTKFRRRAASIAWYWGCQAVLLPPREFTLEPLLTETGVFTVYPFNRRLSALDFPSCRVNWFSFGRAARISSDGNCKIFSARRKCPGDSSVRRSNYLIFLIGLMLNQASLVEATMISCNFKEPCEEWFDASERLNRLISRYCNQQLVISKTFIYR